MKAIDFLRRTLSIEETVNEVEGRIVLGDGKTRKSVRPLALPSFLIELLAEHIRLTGRTDPDGYLFQAPDGGPVRANNFRGRIYRPAQRVTGLTWLTFRQLRQTGGDHMRQAEVALEVIQKRMGHSTIRTTADIYGSLPESVDQEAARRLDALYRQAHGQSADIGEVESGA